MHSQPWVVTVGWQVSYCFNFCPNLLMPVLNHSCISLVGPHESRVPPVSVYVEIAGVAHVVTVGVELVRVINVDAVVLSVALIDALQSHVRVSVSITVETTEGAIPGLTFWTLSKEEVKEYCIAIMFSYSTYGIQEVHILLVVRLDA